MVDDLDKTQEIKKTRRLIIEVDDGGGLNMHYDKVSVFEAPTILKLAAKAVEQQLGIKE